MIDLTNLIYSLIDLGYKGNKFTWYNKTKADKDIFARLDQAPVDHIWSYLYPDAVLTNLPIVKSDHAPILLNMPPYSCYFIYSGIKVK